MSNPNGLIRPGLLGRGIRFVLGGVLFMTLWDLVVTYRVDMWAGELLSLDLGLVISMMFFILTWSWTITETFRVNWGAKPLLVLLVILAGTAVADMIAGPFPGPASGTSLWAAMVLWSAVLGTAMVLAALAAQPGCEMRIYARIIAKIRGKTAEGIACPGGIDRWDHVGSPDLRS